MIRQAGIEPNNPMLLIEFITVRQLAGQVFNSLLARKIELTGLGGFGQSTNLGLLAVADHRDRIRRHVNDHNSGYPIENGWIRDGDPELDRAIAELITRAGDSDNPDLIAELMTTALKLLRDRPDRGELKLFNSALKEMRYSSRVFRSYGDIPKVTIFGSARTSPDHPDYHLAHDFARHMWTRRGWMVVTGAGPGIMEAGNRGAGREGSFGVNIRPPVRERRQRLHPRQPAYQLQVLLHPQTRLRQGITRLRHLPRRFRHHGRGIRIAHVIQTGKAPIQPVVLMEAGDSYWSNWQQFVTDRLLGHGMISRADLSLYKVTNRVEAAADEICRFYLNYHSQRYVEGRLIIRLRHAPTDRQIGMLNEEFRWTC